jgi:phosphotransferase system HPr (HPr) family protein
MNSRIDQPPTEGVQLKGTGMAEPVRHRVVVTNPNGLHLRPATRFAQAARKYSARIEVRTQDKQADGKSAMELVFLIAMPGTELILEIEGDDAAKAAQELIPILADAGEEEAL